MMPFVLLSPSHSVLKSFINNVIGGEKVFLTKSLYVVLSARD